jgi:hypothetical protein
MRTPKESAEIVELTITDIRSSKQINSDLIREVCAKHNISESHIRKVAEFPKYK